MRFPEKKCAGDFYRLGRWRHAGAVEVRAAHVRFGDVDASFLLPRPGLGISRRVLDRVLADHPGVIRGNVRAVRRVAEGFCVQLEETEIAAKVVIDAAGKLSRFTPRVAADQFGVQFYEPETRGDVLDFWFFRDGYGGAVTVEQGRSNACFLISKDALPRYVNRPGCLVTGPVAYDRRVSDFMAIGDAAGMIDPFCGEGMRHALDTGRLAAVAVAEGLAAGAAYDAMRRRYERARSKRWAGKRRLGSVMRWMLKFPEIAKAGFRWNPKYFPRVFWG
jgi:flavin-dependent dehydrogenase